MGTHPAHPWGLSQCKQRKSLTRRWERRGQRKQGGQTCWDQVCTLTLIICFHVIHLTSEILVYSWFLLKFFFLFVFKTFCLILVTLMWFHAGDLWSQCVYIRPSDSCHFRFHATSRAGLTQLYISTRPGRLHKYTHTHMLTKNILCLHTHTQTLA